MRPGAAGHAVTTIAGSEGGTADGTGERVPGRSTTARVRGSRARARVRRLSSRPAGSLTAVTAQCRIRSEYADQLKALIATANARGVGLTPEQTSFLPAGVPGPPTIESCYRSYAGQVWWRTYYCSTGHCELAASPGTSKHGLGRAVDFQDQNGELTFTSSGYAWLTKNAARFGFSQRPASQQGGSSAEAWHWEVQ